MSTRSRIDPDISRRFDVLKLLLMLGVVLVHAERVLHAYLSDPPLSLRIVTTFMDYNLIQEAPSLFFAMSGYLFFVSFTPTPAAYVRMLGKKMRSIGLPYLFFNLLSVAIILTFDKIPYIGDFRTVQERGIWTLVTGIGGLPIISPLWFLRDLLVMFLVSPIFYYLARRIPVISLIGLCLTWNLLPDGNVGWLTFRSVVFFYMGLVLASTRPSLRMGKGLTLFSLSAYPALLVFGTFALITKFNPVATYYAHNAGLIIGIPCIWRLSATTPLRNNQLLLALSPYSFFLYLVHEPTLSYLIYLTRFVLLPTGFFTGMLLYVGLTALTIALALCAGILLARHVPWVYGFLAGARAPVRQGGGAVAAATPSGRVG
ncbi:acyltransferase family protein [Desulfolutivibrio sp.]|uniref:acyltransferase family protein n=1 Tax=Desulfolutivibrio sp. TaxID=2773296 RepID=UPI002F966139